MDKFYRLKILFIIIIAFQFGCAAKKFTLIYHQNDLKSKDLDIITVLPVFDGRRSIQSKMDFQKESEGVQQLILEQLKKKGYDVEAINDTDALGGIQPTQIPFLDASRIREIGPKDAEWILVPIVLDLREVSSFNMTEIICYLFEKTNGKLLWEGSNRYSDLQKATKKLMARFPSNK